MSFYEKIVRSVLFRFDSERAHNFGINALKLALSTKKAQKLVEKHYRCDRFETLQRFGLNFKNPLGMAAGFDKNGVVVNQLASLGFGFVEVGTLTLRAQSGNQKPRMFRLVEDEALINRLGFNNQGVLRVTERLKKLEPNCIVGVNIGKNKDVPNDEAIENYLKTFDPAFEVADYIAVNISSPNTPNLRELQKAEYLEKLLRALQNRNRVLSKELKFDSNTFDKNPNLKPLLVKIAPDLEESEIEAMVDIAQRYEISGMIATNTTIYRGGLRTAPELIKKIGNGGLSGKPLGKKSNEVIEKIFRYSKGKIPVIGVGGIFSAEDAFEKIVSGAGLLQAYSGFVYRGIGFAREINCGLAEILRKKGFKNFDEAVGSRVKL